MSQRENTKVEKVVSGIAWKFMERILAQLVTFIVSVVLARILMPEHYGVVAMVTVFINIANVFVTSGLSTALIQKKEVDDIDYSTVFFFTLMLSIAIYIVLFILAPLIARFYNAPEIISIIRVFSIKILISSYNSMQHAYVARNMIFKKFFFSTLVGTIISGFVGIVMALLGFGAWAIVAQYLTNTIIDTIVLSITIPWKPKRLFSWEAAKPLIDYGWKVLAADLFGTIYNNLNQMLIGHYYTSAELAYYNKGKQVPELICNNVDTTISSVLFPAMSNSSQKQEEIKYMTRRSMRITSYLVFPLMAGIIAVAEPFIRVLLTDKWIEAVYFLQVIALSRAINCITNVNLQAMKALGRSDIVLKLEFLKKPVGITMLFMAIPFGVKWIALSLPLYSVYATLINMQPNKKLLGYGFKEQLSDLTKPFVMSATMCLIVLRLNRLPLTEIVILIVDILTGISVYILLSIVLKDDSFQYILRYVRTMLTRKKEDKRI